MDKRRAEESKRRARGATGEQGRASGSKTRAEESLLLPAPLTVYPSLSNSCDVLHQGTNPADGKARRAGLESTASKDPTTSGSGTKRFGAGAQEKKSVKHRLPRVHERHFALSRSGEEETRGRAEGFARKKLEEAAAEEEKGSSSTSREKGVFSGNRASFKEVSKRKDLQESKPS